MLFIRIIGEVCLKSRNASFIIHHLNGSYGTLIALVAKHTATSLLGLLHCVASQQTINDGDFACCIQLSQPLRSTLTDIVKMRSVAFDDASDSYNGIYLSRVYKGRRTKYKLEATGKANADCCDVGDGITGNDALAIQKLDAKVIKSLPAKSK